MKTAYFQSTALAALFAAALVAPDMAAADGTIRVGTVRAGAFGPLEVHRSVGDYATLVVNQGAVFEALVGVRPEGGTEMLLAESIVPEDDTAKSWLIHLKKGVLFHDGTEMDSEDVVYSLKRMTQDGMILAGMIRPVDAIEAVDKYTVRMRFPTAKSWVIESLSDPYAGIVQDGYEPGKDPIGTGPMKVADLQVQQSITLAKFDGYHGTPASSDEVTVQFFSESQAGLNAIMNDQIDVLMEFDPTLAPEIEGKDGLKLWDSPTGMSFPIQMRTDVAPYNDVRLRQALRLVVDRDLVVNNAFFGYATAANDLYARSDAFFRTDLVRERNVEEARRLIEEAGLTGTNLELVMNGDASVALILAENAREIGLNIDVRQVDSATFYGEEYMERPFFGGDYWPPMSFMQTSSMVDAPNASFGQIRWNDQEYFDIWTVANATLDVAEKEKSLKDLQQILFDRGSWIIPAYPNELIIMDADIEGMPETDLWGRAGYRFLGRLHSTEG